MISNVVINILRKWGWFIDCDTAQKVDLVLQACERAGLKDVSGEPASNLKQFCKDLQYPICIGYREFSKGVAISVKKNYENLKMENITDLFFNAVNTPTPLPISREMWGFINKKWRFIAMDKNGAVYLHQERPHQIKWEYGEYWCKRLMGSLECPLNINTDCINLETSLTERPEGV